MFKTFRNKTLMAKRLAKGVSKFIRFTRDHNQFTLEPTDMDDFFRRHNPFILGVWHGQFLLIPTIRPDDISATIVVGGHKDAQLAAEIVSNFGVTPIRGSGAGGRRVARDRGGAKVLREAIKALKNGDCIVSTVDVPPGPAQRAGPGIITMARLSGRPIVPAAIATKRALTFQSWSRLTINLPFSKGALVAGNPISIPRDASEEELEAYRRQLESAMDEVTKRAYALVGRNPKKILPLWQRSLEPGLALKTYQWATTYAQPLAPFILDYRQKRGKELFVKRNERLGIATHPRPEGPLWWFHAASVGETNAVLPLINSLLEQCPNLNIMLTTGTVTSTKLAEQRLPKRAIHQAIPLDNKSFMARFLAHWRPDLAALVESEIWPNLILETERAGIPLVLLNGRMSKRSFKRWFKKPAMARPLFGRFDQVLAQSATDANHFIALGAEKVINTGNLKADAPPLTFDEEELKKLKEAIGHRPLFLAASTHKGEEEEVMKCHNIIAEEYKDLLTIIIPRHPERALDISQSLSTPDLNIQFRSNNPYPKSDTNIYIANTIGEMGLFYALSDIAFIGGSLIPHGGQNPIEAVRFGTIVLSGPHVRNFAPFYNEFHIRGCAMQIKNGAEMAEKVLEYLKTPDQHAEMASAADEALKFLEGAQKMTETILINDYFKKQ